VAKATQITTLTAALALLAVSALADTLVLKSGERVSGYFEGGSARVIEFRSNDGVLKDYDLLYVQQIQFGEDKTSAEQHDQIAAMRALETGRPLLRATNTGITSAIAHNGREIARLPWFTRGILEVEVTGREGVTPYVRFGDAPAVALAALLLVLAIFAARHKQRSR
jgi:hypothetical protein